RRAKRPPPDTSDPLLTKVREPPGDEPTRDLPQPPPPVREDKAQAEPPPAVPEPEYGSKRPYATRPAERLPSTMRLAPGIAERQVRAILGNRIGEDGPNGVSEFSTKYEAKLVRAAKAMAKRGEV